MTERQAVTAALFCFALTMLTMAFVQPALWEVKLFEVVFQGIVLTGLLNMVAAFHFSANKQNETATENTGRAFAAIEAAANSSPNPQPDIILKPGETAQAEEAQP